MNTVIYGAQGYALGVYNAIKRLYPEMRITCFVVSRMGENASSLAGIPVMEIESFVKTVTDHERANIRFIIATPENVHAEIEDTLERYGFPEHQRITAEKWSELMISYYTQLRDLTPLSSLPKGDKEPSTEIFVAKFHKDKELKNYPTLDAKYSNIQVGAATTDVRIADIRDDNGNNISDRNGNYSELTGLYWIWKNVLEKRSDVPDEENKYYGFAQYRRMLMFSEGDLTRVAQNDVDVVLPFPLMYEPDINEHHKRYVKDSDWKALLFALREIQPAYADYLPKALKQQYMFNYNVILAKKHVLNDYCSWLFPVLLRIEELSDPKGSERSDRYIGYIGETLETLYFLKNRNELNITHVGCKLYI